MDSTRWGYTGTQGSNCELNTWSRTGTIHPVASSVWDRDKEKHSEHFELSTSLYPGTLQEVFQSGEACWPFPEGAGGGVLGRDL